MGEAGAFAFWLAVGLASLGFTFGPLGHAIARRIESRGGRAVPDTVREQLERLENRAADLDGVEQRLLEVEERLDFAERMLASGRPSVTHEADTPPASLDAGR
jgi:hypothetical protein